MKVLEELEKIDDDADAHGINMVKIDDNALAKKYGVFAIPAILFFNSEDKQPVIYAGESYRLLNVTFLNVFDCTTPFLINIR